MHLHSGEPLSTLSKAAPVHPSVSVLEEKQLIDPCNTQQWPADGAVDHQPGGAVHLQKHSPLQLETMREVAGQAAC